MEIAPSILTLLGVFSCKAFLTRLRSCRLQCLERW